MSNAKILTLIFATIATVTACTHFVGNDPYNDHAIQLNAYCDRVAAFERTRHLPLEDIKGHSNYLGEDCGTNN